MKRLLTVGLLAASLAGCGDARPTGGGPADGRVLPSEASDGLVLAFGSQPDPLTKGDGSVQITVKTASGAAVTDAQVSAVFSMPAMPSMNMPAMSSATTLQHAGDGRYQGTSQLSMGGTWNVVVSVTRPSQPAVTRRLSVVVEE